MSLTHSAIALSWPAKRSQSREQFRLLGRLDRGILRHTFSLHSALLGYLWVGCTATIDAAHTTGRRPGDATGSRIGEPRYAWRESECGWQWLTQILAVLFASFFWSNPGNRWEGGKESGPVAIRPPRGFVTLSFPRHHYLILRQQLLTRVSYVYPHIFYLRFCTQSQQWILGRLFRYDDDNAG